MRDFEKRKILNDFIFNKINLCKQESLLSDDDKKTLKKIVNSGVDTSSDFFMMLSDELQEQKKYQKTKSYVYTYKQAQALIYCCKCLKYDITVDVVFNDQEISDILNNFDTDFDIIRELDYLFVDYIKITKRRSKKNESYKKRIKTNI